MKIQSTSVYSGDLRIEGINSLIDIDLCSIYSHVVVGPADPDKYETQDYPLPTSRLLDGTADDWAAEEWAEPGEYGGKGCIGVYLFDYKAALGR